MSRSRRFLPLVNGDVVVRRYRIRLANLPTGLHGLQIVHISDFHFRRWHRPAQQAHGLLQKMPIDLLAVTGDFCISHRQASEAVSLIRRFFAPIGARLGQFAVTGNHDPPDLPDRLAGTDLTFLPNRSVALHTAGGTIHIAGLACHAGSRDERPDLALADRPPHALSIVLAHYPSAVRKLRGLGVDLVLAGHTHGGQWRCPRIGCIWAHDAISRHYSHGLHRLGGVLMHVTAGLGTTGPAPLRLNCPPEIAVLQLLPR
ncbi:MAG: metallophosphoesterase [Phycisphaerae bacterium]